MNRHELQKPLLQSALVLLAILVLIGFVAGSNAESFLGGILSIFKGVLYTVLFAVGLIIALIFSIALLFAIFLGAIAIYSPESSRDMYYALRTRTEELLSPWLSRLPTSRRSVKRPAVQNEKTADTETMVNTAALSSRTTDLDTTESLNTTRTELLSKIDAIGKDISQLNREHRSLTETVSQLERNFKEMVAEKLIPTASNLKNSQDEQAASLSDCTRNLEQISSSLKDNDKRIQQQEIQLKDSYEKISLLAAEIAELRTIPAETGTEDQNENLEENYRIFSYLEKENDKKQFAELIEKAVEKDMTYTEIDEFLSQELPREVDTVIKEHPVLTKEYIRLRRQNQE